MATAETGAANTPVYVRLPREADAELMRLTNFIFLITANTTPVPKTLRCCAHNAMTEVQIHYVVFMISCQ